MRNHYDKHEITCKTAQNHSQQNYTLVTVTSSVELQHEFDTIHPIVAHFALLEKCEKLYLQWYNSGQF